MHPTRLQFVCSVFLLALMAGAVARGGERHRAAAAGTDSSAQPQPAATSAAGAKGGGERLLLVSDLEKHTREITVGVRKPFTVVLVAERDAEKPQLSTIAFKLEVPDGIVIVGEEQLVQSLVALGTPRAGMHLAFQCVEAKQVPVYSFKMLATKPLEKVSVRTLPEDKTAFLGIIACRDENFEKWSCPAASFTITAR